MAKQFPLLQRMLEIAVVAGVCAILVSLLKPAKTFTHNRRTEGSPQLRLVDFGSNEPANPMRFALKIANNGGDVLIDAIEANTTSETIIGDLASGNYPSSFRATVDLMDPTPRGDRNRILPAGKETTITGGTTATTVWRLFVWHWPADSPPYLAIISTTFTLKHKGKAVLTTPAYAFVLQSREGVVDAVMRDAGKNPASDAELLKVLTELDGKPSASVRELRERLESKKPPAA